LLDLDDDIHRPWRRNRWQSNNGAAHLTYANGAPAP